VARAELTEDGGDAATSEEFFRSAAFYAAEGVTHTLLVEDDAFRVALPLVVRAITGTELRDATSPYGYPGGEREGRPPNASEIGCAGAGLVSSFLRERLGEGTLAGGNERSRVQVADPELPRKSRMSDRQQIRKNERRGYTVRRVLGPESGESERASFVAIYEQTMHRTEAADRYFFEPRYFDLLLASERTWLWVCEAPGGEEVAAAAIVALSDGFLHYYLSGTADAHLSNAPSKNLIAAVIDFAEQQERPVNLGGGVRPGDGLEEFKRGFANRELPFITHELVCDRAAYDRLASGREAGDFFPAYRAPR
jgi:Acetyltransferase (GNAT) domain